MTRKIFNHTDPILQALSTAGILTLMGILFSFSAIIGCGDDAITDCTATTFTMDNSIRELCDITVDADHIALNNLSLNNGTFTIYAGTASDGTGGGKFTFSPNGPNINLDATYRDGGDNQSVTDSTAKYWLIGFHEESPGAHIIVKSSDTEPSDWEAATADINREPGEWTEQSLPATGTIYYRGKPV